MTTYQMPYTSLQGVLRELRHWQHAGRDFVGDGYKELSEHARLYSPLNIRLEDHAVVDGEGSTPRARLYLLNETQQAADLQLPDDTEYDWAANYAPAGVGVVDVRVLRRGSVEMAYHDIVTGVHVNGYGHGFVAMTQAVMALAQEDVRASDRLSMRDRVSRVYRLGVQARDAQPSVRALNLAARLNLDDATRLRLLREGELERYAVMNVPFGYIADLLAGH